MRKWIVAAILLVAAGLVGFGYWRTARYDPLIRKYATEYRLDFHLVKALIHEESRFNSEARGNRGELGLMQIKPNVGQEFWERKHRPGQFDPNVLLLPEQNIEVGCWYLRDSFDMYRGSPHPLIYGLARYNAGQTRVARWMNASNTSSPEKVLAQIDFPTTRQYIQRVVQRSQRRSQNYFW